MIDRHNPLTARVAVNRVWKMHFGRGIVATLDDFGSQGKLPTHPELLDWLAGWFMDNGWDVKALHRLIVTSATFRQSSQPPREVVERDPENLLLARGPKQRLPAEEIRDRRPRGQRTAQSRHRRAECEAVSTRRTLGSRRHGQIVHAGSR
jgi:hypothetical protein